MAAENKMSADSNEQPSETAVDTPVEVEQRMNDFDALGEQTSASTTDQPLTPDIQLPVDISVYLHDIQHLWHRNVLNLSEWKELKKIMLNPAHHLLIADALCHFMQALQRMQSPNTDHNDEKQDNEPDDDAADVYQLIRAFQSAIRPCIARAMQLSYSSSCNASIYDVILTQLMDNSALNKHTCFFIERAIFSISDAACDRLQFSPFQDASQADGDDKKLAIGDCKRFVSCSAQQQLNTFPEVTRLFDRVLSDEVEIYAQCVEQLNDELTILNSIFSAQDRMVVHCTFPTVIELCLSSTNNLGKLYLTFLCEIGYPVQSAMQTSVYFCGPPSFATNNEIFAQLETKMHEMAMEATGEPHLFEIVQYAKEWIERHEQNYTNPTMTTDLRFQMQYTELRSALGLIEKATPASEQQSTSSPSSAAANCGDDPREEDADKTYVWYLLDLNNNWMEFPKNMQKKINNLPINDGELSFSTDCYDYVIVKTSPAKGTQTNVVTGNERPIKRKLHKRRQFVSRTDTHKPQSPDEYIRKRGRTKKERRAQREQLESDKKAGKYKYSRVNKEAQVHYYSDEECDEQLRAKQFAAQQRMQQKIHEEKLATQCYSQWEIDETIQELIRGTSAQWACPASEAKKKLVENLWVSEQGFSVDAQLQKHKQKQTQNNNKAEGSSGLDSLSADLMLRPLAPQSSQLSTGGDLAQLEWPELCTFECPVCLEPSSMLTALRLHCQHSVCVACLSSYIFNQIDNGILCIKCPQFKCTALLEDCVIHCLSDTIAYCRYRSFLQNSFLETSKEWKFCPNPQCNSAIKAKRDIPLVSCHCGTPLCTSCMQKVHWPLKCKENQLWAEKTKTKIKLQDPNLPALPKFEGQKIEMTVQTKPCPKCKTQWEKDGGCNHINCRKCGYHFCWVCMNEFIMGQNHSDWYNCAGQNVSTSQTTLEMELPTEAYQAQFQAVMAKRREMRENHEAQLAATSEQKMRTRKAIEHEHASIYLQQKYLNRPRRMKALLRNITQATQSINETVPRSLNMEFMCELISRMIQAHLLLSRGYKYVSYHAVVLDATIVCILQSLEHVAFKLDAMFQEPKQFLPWKQCRWKWYDLGFYMDFLVDEINKHKNVLKKSKRNSFPDF